MTKFTDSDIAYLPIDRQVEILKWYGMETKVEQHYGCSIVFACDYFVTKEGFNSFEWVSSPTTLKGMKRYLGY